MHPAISDFPSGHFYDGQVVSGIRQSDRPTPRGFPWPTETAPVAFVLVNGKGHGDGQGDGEAGEPRGASWRGQLERRGGVETAVQGGSGGAVLSSSSTLGTSYCNDREAWAVASALELVVGGGDVEVSGKRRVARSIGRSVGCHPFVVGTEPNVCECVCVCIC